MHSRFVYGAGALMALLAGSAHAQVMSNTAAAPYCREFTKVVTVGGQPQSAYGTACYQPDGSWQIVSDDISPSQPVQYYPAQNQVVYVQEPTPATMFSFSFDSYDPYRTRYYNRYGHGWRDWGRGRDWDDRWDHHPGRGRGHWDNDWHGHR